MISSRSFPLALAFCGTLCLPLLAAPNTRLPRSLRWDYRAPQPSPPRSSMNMQSFLARQDMVWSSLPSRWEEGAFIGDGDQGAMIWRDAAQAASSTSPSPGASNAAEPGEALHWEVNRASVIDRGHRLPIGRLKLLPIGQVQDDADDAGAEVLRLDLWNGTARGIVKTNRGSIAWRSLSHQGSQVLAIETQATGGEADFKWRYDSHAAIDPALTYRKLPIPEDQILPAAEVLERDGLRVIRQPLHKAAYAVAWREQVLGPGRRRVLLSIGFAQNADASKAMAQAESEASGRVQNAAQVLGRDAQSWEAAHQNRWRQFWNRSWVSLPDARMEAFYAIQMYKLGSAMRQDGPMCDLMGPWFRTTPWAKIWWNLNIQLTYWPVYASNHLDLGRSFSDSIDRNLPALIQNVRQEWRSDSIAMGRTSSYDLKAGEWKEFGNLVWALQLYEWQARYEGDPATLRRLFPILHRAVSYMDHRLERGEDGRLHFPTAISPEYEVEAPDANYNLALMRWGAQSLLQIAGELKIEDAKAARWRQVLAELAPYPEDPAQGLMIGRGVPLAHSHRHFSHLFAWYPLGELDPDDAQARPLLERSLDHWISFEGALQGYSFTGAAAMASTLGSDPRRREDAVRYLNEFQDRFVKPNTMYTELGPVIETPLAGARTIQELLLRERNGALRIFPGVPASWRDASFSTLRAPGAFLVSAQRRNGATQSIRIQSLKGAPLRLICDIPNLAPDKRLKRDGNAWSIALKAGEEITLRPANARDLAPLAPVENARVGWNAWGSRKMPVALANADGGFSLSAKSARIHGSTMFFQKDKASGNLGRWIDASDWVSWTLDVPRAHAYRVRLSYASPGGGSRFAVIAKPLPSTAATPSPQIEGEVAGTGSFDEFKYLEAGTLKLDKGRARLELRAREIKGALWNLRSVDLVPVE